MSRTAIYARYSSDQQRDASIEDQVRVCRERAEREGWSVVNTYTDHGISGASMMRPGIQMLMQDVAVGKIDIVLTEDLDRLSRDQEDIAGIYKRISFADGKIITLADGEVNDLHIGLKGTMSARYLKDLAQKTRRGLRGRVEAGKSGGGKAYGYDVVHTTDSKGETERGGRRINPDAAAIVKRIFEEYAAGHSPKSIAVKLNKEGVQGPRGRNWGASTIYGNRRRGLGIINNELYIGRIIWNRMRYPKNPDTGKRNSRVNPEEDWIIKECPELRIIDQELWQKVKDRQGKLDEKAPEFWKKRRPVNLLSYLLKCGECGGGFSKISSNRYGCSTARNKGTCDNRRTIDQKTLEETVLGVLHNRLMNPSLCDAYCVEYTRHLNECARHRNAEIGKAKAGLEKLAREREKLIQAIKDGVPGSEVKEDFERIIASREKFEAILENTEEEPAIIHPAMAQHYRQAVGKLVEALNDEEHRAEAADILRSLVDKIVLTPKDDKGLAIDLYGDLAGILTVAHNRERPLDRGDISLRQVKMVEGAGFEPA